MARKFSPIVGLALVFALFFHDQDSFEPESVREKRVLVTGASSGIGRELALQYCKLGASVVVTARRQDHVLAEVADRCKAYGAKSVHHFGADMSDKEERLRLVTEVKDVFGDRLDYLLLSHSTSGLGHWRGSAENLTLFEHQLNVNVLSYVDVVSHFLSALNGTGGKIGVVTPVSGRIGLPLLSTESTSQFALHGFFSALRQELRARQSGISVTLCVLGHVETVTSQVEDILPLTFFGPASVDAAAMAIIKGVSKGTYDMYFPRFVWYFLNIHKFLGGYLEDLVTYRQFALNK